MKLNRLCHEIRDTRRVLSVLNNGYEGRCFDFYLDMKKAFPQAVALYDGNHILVLIDGVVVDAKSAYLPFKELEPVRYKNAKEWSSE